MCWTTIFYGTINNSIHVDVFKNEKMSLEKYGPLEHLHFYVQVCECLLSYKLIWLCRHGKLPYLYCYCNSFTLSHTNVQWTNRRRHTLENVEPHSLRNKKNEKNQIRIRVILIIYSLSTMKTSAWLLKTCILLK